MAEAPDDETFEITLTAADQAAFLRYIARQPFRVALFVTTFGLMWVSFVMMQLAIGLIGALFAARPYLWAAGREYLTTDFVEDLRTTAPIFTGLVLLLAALSFFVLIPRQCRLLGAKIMDAYPGPASGKAVKTRLRFDDRGIESTADFERLFLAWPFAQSLVETKRHMFLMVGKAQGFVVPKACLDAESLERFRAVVERRLAEATSR